MDAKDTTLDPAVLREHDRFVRAIARRLLQDAEDADDAAQDAWRIAMSGRRPAHVPLRAWLAGIVRNLARRRKRDAARRERLDRRIEAPMTGAPADELVAKTEMERRILQAVLSIDDPIRTALLLRFRQGLSPSAIARRLGVPAGTVRWRLHRGIELLRERLDEAHGGRRERWLPGVALVAASDPIPFLTATTLGGLLIMHAKILTLCAPEPTLTAPDPARETARDEDAGRDVAAGAALDPPGAAASVALTVTGRCVSDRGEALEGVSVAFVARERARDGWPGDEAADGRVESDAVGRFLIEVPAAPDALAGGGPSEQILRFTRADLVPRTLSTFQVTAERVDLGDVTLEFGASIEGRVVDEAGQGIAGASVVATRRLDLSPLFRDLGIFGRGVSRAETDDFGRFSLRGVPAGWYRVVAVAGSTFHGATDPIGVTARERHDGVTLVLPSLGDRVIEGVALDADGFPVANAGVWHGYEVGNHGYSGGIATDAQGRFRVRAFDPAPHAFRLRRDGAEARVEGVMPGTRDVVLRLPATRRASIRVIDAVTGAPVTEYTGSVLASGHGTPFDGGGADGSSTYPLPDAEYTIRVTARGYHPTDEGPFDPLAPPPEVVVALEPAPVLRGRVTAAGVPVAGARVSVLHANNPMEMWGFPMRALPLRDDALPVVTGADGRFEIRLRHADETIYVRAESAGLAPAEAGPFAWPDGPLPPLIELRMDEGGAIEGTVRVREGAAASGILVAASRGDGFPIATRTDEQGRYRFDRLTAGPWQVELRPSDYDPFAVGSAFGLVDDAAIPSNCEVTAGAVTRHDLSLRQEERCVLAGTALRGAAPRPGLVVSLYPCRDPAAWRAARERPETFDSRKLRGTRATAAYVMPDGAYELQVVEPGSYIAVLSDTTLPGAADSEVEALVELVPGRMELDFGIAYGRIEGVVTGPPRNQERGHLSTRIDWVVPLSATMLARGFGFARSDGAFALESVVAGSGLVRGTGAWTEVAVAAGETTRVTIE